MTLPRKEGSFRNCNKTDLLIIPLLIVIGFATFIIAYKQAAISSTDISLHMGFGEAMFRGEDLVTYPGWYLFYGMFSFLPKNMAAALASSVLNVLCSLVIYAVLNESLGNKWYNCIIVLFMAFFGPLYLHYPDHYYLAPGSFNTWHNPTNTSVKFLAIFSFFLLPYSIDLKKDEYTVLCGRMFTKRKIDIVLCVSVFLSLLFKPSFFQVFAPTLIIIYLIQWLILKEKTFADCLKDCVIYIPSVLLVLYQMMDNLSLTGKHGQGIEIAFLKVWKLYASNIPLAVLSLAFFPLFVGVFCVKNWKKERAFLYAGTFFGVSVAEYAVLSEAGERWADGNFGWGKNLAFGVLMLSAIIAFIRYVQNPEEKNEITAKMKISIGLILLLAHFLLGIWYFVQLLFAVNGKWY